MKRLLLRKDLVEQCCFGQKLPPSSARAKDSIQRILFSFSSESMTRGIGFAGSIALATERVFFMFGLSVGYTTRPSVVNQLQTALRQELANSTPHIVRCQRHHNILTLLRLASSLDCICGFRGELLRFGGQTLTTRESGVAEFIGTICGRNRSRAKNCRN